MQKLKKETKTKLLTIRVSESELKIIRSKKFNGKKSNIHELVRKILLNLPEYNSDKICIFKDGYSISKKGIIL